LVTVNLTVKTTGDLELPAARFTYTFLGRDQFRDVELSPVKVFSGIGVSVSEREVVLGSVRSITALYIQILESGLTYQRVLSSSTRLLRGMLLLVIYLRVLPLLLRV